MDIIISGYSTGEAAIKRICQMWTGISKETSYIEL